ncbi:MAG: aldo/keto reductase [Anaerolineae bacterium]
MQYRELGSTGLRVSVLGFGASPLGNEFATIDPAEGARAVADAIDRGINYFDVSPYYGRTLAETRLGEALAGRRHEVILATKAGRYDRDRDTGFDFSAARILRSIDESLARLRTDYVDVFQVHDIEYGRKEQILSETLPAMFRLKEQGRARFVGVTGYPLHLLRDVAGQAPVDTVLSYCRYDLLDTGMERLLFPLAQQRHLGLISASPLHMRLLTEQGAPDWHPAPRRVRAAAAEAARYCRERGFDIADLALRFALAQPAIATTLVGMSRIEHVQRNTALVGTAPDPDLLAEVCRILAPVADTVWKEGRPENDDPGAVEKQS